MQNTVAHDGVITVDPHYIHPERAAVYLIAEEGRAAFVDANTARAVPVLLKALEERGLTPEQVEYVIVTHVHLDHSGGTAALLRACPNAVALVHPRGERHLADPARLVRSARRVYGEDVFKSLHGGIEAIDAARIRTVEDHETLRFGRRTLTFLHTAGHAKHHICIHDSGSNGVFTGDAFGTSYPALQRGHRPYLICSAPPTDFDAAEARETVRKVVETGAEHAFVTHFGPFSPVKEGAEELLRSIDDMEAIRAEAEASGLKGIELKAFCAEGVDAAIRRQLARCGIELGRDDLHWIQADTHMNALGLAYSAEKAREEAK